MSVNSKMTAIADAIRLKTGGTGLLTLDDMAQDIAAIDTSENLDDVLDEQDSIIEQIQIALEGKAFPKGASIDVITAPSLPATVVENQIVVITDTAAGTIYVDTDEPASPVNGDVWVQVGSSDYGVEFSETFRNGLNKAHQYSGNMWATMDGYIGISGVWRQFATGLPPVGTPLSNWTWAQLVALANSDADVTQYFAIGDTKNLELSTGETLVYVLGDFNHSTITGTSRRAKLAFTPHPKCLNATQQMNAADTNVGSWGGSSMRNTHMTNILSTFPPELTADGAIKFVNVPTTAGNKSTEIVVTSDRLRLHSLTELGYSGSNIGIEGAAYPFYTVENRIKTVNGTKGIYWTRSPVLDSAALFGWVDANGTDGYNVASLGVGVAPCFDI